MVKEGNNWNYGTDKGHTIINKREKKKKLNSKQFFFLLDVDF